MALTDDIAEAEQQARDALIDSLEWCYPTPEGDEGCDADLALSRYAAICRLAGRWEFHTEQRHVVEYEECSLAVRTRADLARLSPVSTATEPATQEMPEGEA